MKNKHIVRSVFYSGVFLFLTANQAFATTLDDAGAVASQVETNVKSVKSLLISGGGLVGLALCLIGMFLFYKNYNEPNQGHAKKGVVALAVGSGLLSIISIIAIITGTWGGSGADAKTAVEASTGFGS